MCGGRGCQACGERGRVDVTGCPRADLPPIVWDLLTYADLYRKGLPPVAGGALDQAAAFVEAARFIWNEHDQRKAKHGQTID